MRIAFLCKRRFSGKDVIVDRFGRLYEIPMQLARMGHDVRGYCMDYHQLGTGVWRHDVPEGALSWESRSLGKLWIPAMLGYPRHLLGRLSEFAPDLLIGASDIPHVAMTAWLARLLGVPCAIDLYDNFESFGLAQIPGSVAAYRRAIRGADFLTVVSEPLEQLVKEKYHARCPVVVMPNAIDKEVFRGLNRSDARRLLGLPLEAKLVGTAGGLQRSKGVETLYSAWDLLKARHPDIHLVLAGPTEAQFPPPQGERVHYLGQVPQTRVAELFSALDVGVITLLDSAFGRYCFPQKLHEMLACHLPVVAAAAGVMPSLLRNSPNLLFASLDAEELAGAVLRQLEAQVVPELQIADWAQLVAGIEPDLVRLQLAPDVRRNSD